MNNSSNLNNSINFKVIDGYAYTAAVFFSFIGLSANIFLLYILIKHKIFEKTTYYLLRISVISDIICNLTTITGYIMVIAANLSYSDGQTLCRCLMFIILSSYGISIMTLCVIGIDRYFVIAKPLSSFYRRRKQQIISGQLVLVTIIVFASTLPELFFASSYPDDTKFCDLINITPTVSYYLIMITITLYIIPAITLTISYSKIIFYLRNYVRPGESIINPNSENHKKKKFINTLISIATAYLLISWPFFATCLGMAITRRPLRQVRQLGVVYYMLTFFSFSTTTAISILNPYLYFKFDSAIRSKAKMHLSSIYDKAKSRILTAEDGASNTQLIKVISHGNGVYTQ